MLHQKIIDGGAFLRIPKDDLSQKFQQIARIIPDKVGPYQL